MTLEVGKFRFILYSKRQTDGRDPGITGQEPRIEFS